MVLRSCKALGNYQPLITLRDKLDADVRAILKQNIQLTYYMRGAIDYESMLQRTPVEKQMISEFITERLESQHNVPRVTVY